MDKVAFIDLEASGLGPESWPIEVGWCFEAGAPEAHLIAPAPDWRREAWDANAEALHGISFASLAGAGAPAEKICAMLNRALDGARVYSDAPDWDGFWLYRLFCAANTRQEFMLLDFETIFGGMAKSGIRALIKAASRTAPHRHRACDDVLHMRALYALAQARTAHGN